jgi:hypothetical protein
MFATDGRMPGFDGVQAPVMIGVCGAFDDPAIRFPGFETTQEPVVMTVDGMFVARVGAAATSTAMVRTTRGKFIVVPPDDDDSPDKCRMRSNFARPFPP